MEFRTKKEIQVINSLKEKGFEEDIIRRALKRTNSYDENELVECIAELLNNPQLIDEEEKEKQRLLDQIKERKLEQLREKEYLERIKQRIAESRLDKPKIMVEESEVQKTKPVFGECTVKVRYEEKSVILHLNKDDTVEVLRNKVKDAFSIKNFKMRIFNPSKELINDSENMNEAGLVPNGVVIIE
ncbi:hypothetical protein TUBRATIS_002640 [Tubulinosema ratisbonensis]|uniref:Ubiquitin-like domain-containing protein n=1 Tax=Tubulinosema ratisbonensis TaxID=291195 RepID=A0A437APX7_9MICR|nr:hypothetical protein TUBRATIS_002640 [Tubulinosema ratisbonensis]